METITVSVVTIVRNDCKNIEKTIRSVLEQTYTEFEYVIKDGLSTDGTKEIIKNICKQYPERKITIISCKDVGIYDAMNQAMDSCKGEWISFINSGDSFFDENVLVKVFDEKEKYANAGVVYGDAIVRDESGDAVWKADFDLIEKKMPFCHQSCFVKKQYAIQYKFDTMLRIAADYNQMLDLYVNRVPFESVDMIIAIFELDGVSSTKFIDRLRERNMVIEKHGICNKNKMLQMIEFIMETIKTILIRIVPYRMMIHLKKWYKVNVKHYEIEK